MHVNDNPPDKKVYTPEEQEMNRKRFHHEHGGKSMAQVSQENALQEHARATGSPGPVSDAIPQRTQPETAVQRPSPVPVLQEHVGNETSAPSPQVKSVQIESRKKTETPVTTPASTSSRRFGDPDQMKLDAADEMIRILQKQRDENPVETPEQRKKRERREKWEGVISGIGDAASAISNLITTTKYAPDMYDGNSSLSKSAKSRFDKAKAERDEKLRQHLHYAMNINKLKLKKAADMKQMEADKLARAKADAQQKRDDDLYDLQLAVLRAKRDEQEANARKANQNADDAAGLNQAEIDRRKGAANRSQGAANLSNTKASKIKNGVELQSNGYWRAYDHKGVAHYFKEKEMADRFAGEEGTWKEGQPYTETTQIVKETPRGTETETRTYTKRGQGYSQKPQKPKGKGYGSANSKKSDSGGSFYD